MPVNTAPCLDNSVNIGPGNPASGVRDRELNHKKMCPNGPAPSLIDFAHALADLASAAILPHFRRRLRVTNKGGGARYDPVTVADRAAERTMRAAIAKQFPDHGIVGEEFAPRAAAGPHQWVLDPIDGTRAFIMGSPLWGILIGLLEDGVPMLGLMDQPYIRERSEERRV